MSVDIKKLIPKCDDEYCIVSLKEIGSSLGSRDLIEYLLEVTGGKKLILDFTGVEFISRGFADELHTYIITKLVIPINMSDDVKRMIKIVEKSRKSDRNKF